MPPRRRKAAAASSSTAAAAAAPVAKKPKTSLSLSWEWEDDGETWTAFSEDMLQKINDSYDQDEMKVEMTVNKVKFNILLDKMVQKNAKTGWERRIRCLVKDASDYYVWQWQDEKKRWNPYTANDTITIEMSYQAGEESVGIVAFHRSYTIDLKKMDQLNDVTKVTRTVERIKVDHKPAKADKASVSESNGSVSASAEKTSGKKSQKTKRKVKEEKVDDDDDDDNDGDVKPSTSKSEAKNIKTVVMKGKAPVDPECHAKVGKAEVFWEGNDIYDVMLNQTNLMNNNNKYYLIQLLKDEGKNVFSVWQRWGRVGKAGQSNLVACGPDLDEAKKVFMKKFRDKTLNDWANRHSFTKVQGKYDIVEMDYSAKDDVTETDSKSKAKKKETTIPDSKLDQRLQALVEMICNVKAMEDTVIEMKYDAKKAPLGKLTDDQIKAGLGALKEIEHCIKNNIIGNRLIQACDAYYTRIPHDFGMKRPPVIRSEDDLQREIDLLEALGDIQIAMNIIKSETGEIANPIDRHYSAMKCQLNPLEKTDPEFKLVCDYVKNTHAITHNQYKMEVLDVFAVDKDKEQELFKDYGNRMLLWHGSRLTNYMGILSKGLRIAPPEAPVTGYMFGKGVYFADMSSKSANYCFATKSKDVGLCLLSEVSLGTANELLNADYKADKLPAGKHSVKGLGRIAPDPSKNHTTSDGTVVPLGKGINTGVTNPQGYTLNYNEYIVYNTNQIKMRYLVKIKFHFK